MHGLIKTPFKDHLFGQQIMLLSLHKLKKERTNIAAVILLQSINLNLLKCRVFFKNTFTASAILTNS